MCGDLILLFSFYRLIYHLLANNFREFFKLTFSSCSLFHFFMKIASLFLNIKYYDVVKNSF